MPVELGPIKIKTELDTEGLKKQLDDLFSDESVDRIQTFKDSLGNLPGLFEDIVSGMLKLETRSASMSIAVKAGFDLMYGAAQSFGAAWQNMLLSGEMSAKTFGEAMKAMVASELAAISASAIVNAIYATAIGLLRLAMWDFSSAASAFTAAATFAAVAVAAGIGAIALTPKGGGYGYGEGGYDEYGPSYSQTDQVEQANQKRFLTLNVQGNILGQEEYIKEQFIPALNTLVMEDDAVVVSSDRNTLARTSR